MFNILNKKNNYFLILILYECPEDPALRNIIFLNFCLFQSVIFAYLDLDPIQIRIRDTVRNQSFSGYLKGHGNETNFSIFSKPLNKPFGIEKSYAAGQNKTGISPVVLNMNINLIAFSCCHSWIGKHTVLYMREKLSQPVVLHLYSILFLHEIICTLFSICCVTRRFAKRRSKQTADTQIQSATVYVTSSELGLSQSPDPSPSK